MAILGLQPLVFGGVEGVLFRRRCNGIVDSVWLSRKTLSQKKIYASNGVVIERYSLYSNYWRYTSHILTQPRVNLQTFGDYIFNRIN